VLAGISSIHDFGLRLELLPPSGHQQRFVFGPQLWFAVWLGVPTPLQFGCGFPGCVPGGVGVGGPVLVSGVAGFEALAFGGQLGSKGCGPGCAGVVMLDFGVGGLLESVGFGLHS
jgi:hypothetical protein